MEDNLSSPSSQTNSNNSTIISATVKIRIIIATSIILLHKLRIILLLYIKRNSMYLEAMMERKIILISEFLIQILYNGSKLNDLLELRPNDEMDILQLSYIISFT